MATTVTLKPNAIDISGSTSGTTTLQATAVAGTTTLTLPAATDTLVGKATTDTLTNKTLTTPVISSLSSAAATALTLQSAGTTAITVDTSQNVGVGVTPSAWSTLLPVQVKNGYIAGLNNRVYVGANNYYDGSNSRYIATDFATRYYQLNGIHGWEAAPSGTAGNVITFTQVLAVEKAKSLALEGATSVSGTGISFPATQSASSDANTLDDYEEGTWTPTLQGSTTNPTVTYATQTGSYTKVGNMVTVFVRLQTSAVSGGSGTALIGGLPFAVNSTGYRNGGAIGYFSGVTLSAGNTQMGLSPDVGASTIRFVQSGSGIGASTILVGGIGAALDIVFTFTYSV